jgi:hypothetical protein
MVGMLVNGRDPLTADGKPQSIPARKGKPHLMRLLETLARVEITDNSALVPLIQGLRYQLAWGTTLIVITGRIGAEVLDELYQARRWGQNALLIQAGRDSADEVTLRRARILGIPVFSIATEHDLKIWTQESRRA